MTAQASIVVEPRIVQPKKDYVVGANGESITYRVPTQKRGGQLLGLFVLSIAFIPLIALLGATLLSMGSRNAPTIWFFVGFVALLAVVVAVIRRGFETVMVPITIDKSKISVGGRAYLVDHIEYLGWRASGGVIGHDKSGMVQAAHNTSGLIYIKYGGDEVVLVKGIHPDRVEMVDGDIKKHLKAMGHDWN